MPPDSAQLPTPEPYGQPEQPEVPNQYQQPYPSQPVQPSPPPPTPQQYQQYTEPPATQAETMEGLDSDERLITEIRRHFFGIFIIYVETFLALVVGIGLVYFLLPNFVDRSQDNVYRLVGIVAGVIVVVMALVMVLATYIYYSSKLVLTNRNITQFLRIGIVNKKVSQLDIANIEDVNAIKKGLFANILNFGTLNFETAGAMENFSFNYCPNPDHYAKQILEARERVREQRRDFRPTPEMGYRGPA